MASRMHLLASFNICTSLQPDVCVLPLAQILRVTLSPPRAIFILKAHTLFSRLAPDLGRALPWSLLIPPLGHARPHTSVMQQEAWSDGQGHWQYVASTSMSMSPESFCTLGNIWQMPVAIAFTTKGLRVGIALCGGPGVLLVLEGAMEGTGVGGGGAGMSAILSSSDISCSQAWVMLRRKLLSCSTSQAIFSFLRRCSSSGIKRVSFASFARPMPVLTTDLSTPHLLLIRLLGLSGASLIH
mmetsp:Transcript_57358/g.117413  ORF Transcript_57358/g.117413 Transcript_57358/m.117413 type:complete len:241 (-) Transcript_57358:659-1381(-)